MTVSVAPAVSTARYRLQVAGTPAEVAAAQRLRYEVFAGELGVALRTPVAGLDVDEFDAHCDHLIVREVLTGAVVGTYRLLPPGRVTSRYSAGEFDLSALADLEPDLVEAGRSCVHPAHRDGAVINLMWAGLARYLHLAGHRWLAGCASIPLSDGGATAAATWDLVSRRHLAPAARRVVPHRPWVPVERPAGRLPVPPLLRGYLRLGAQVCGAPAYDPEFDCVDLYVLLDLDHVDSRYLRHFLGEPG